MTSVQVFTEPNETGIKMRPTPRYGHSQIQESLTASTELPPTLHHCKKISERVQATVCVRLVDSAVPFVGCPSV